MAPSQFTVAVLPLGNISEYQIELTEFVLQAVLGVKTLVLPAAKIPLSCLNAKTDRYSTDKLLDYLFFQLPENAQRIMGVTEANLETDDGHTSLGSAQPFDRVACYQVPPSEENTSQLGESFHLIIHEFLHTLGMHHCAEKNCVLHFIEFGMEICDRCDRWLKRELSISPHSAEERFSLAESFYRYNCLPQAIAAYREAAKLEPRNSLYHHSLSNALQKLEQFDEAKLEMVKAVAHAKDYPDFYYNSGLNCLREDDLQKAEECFCHALASNSDRQKICRLIGQAYAEVAHDTQKACAYYKKYLDLGGNDQDVIDWLISRSQLDQN